MLVQTSVGFLSFLTTRFFGVGSLKSSRLSRRGDASFGWLSPPHVARKTFAPTCEKQGWFFINFLGLSSGVNATTGSCGRSNFLGWKSNFLRRSFSPTSSVFSFRFLATEDILERVLRLLLAWSELTWAKGEPGTMTRTVSSVGVPRELSSPFLLTPLTLGVVADTEAWRTLSSILLTDEGVGSKGE